MSESPKEVWQAYEVLQETGIWPGGVAPVWCREQCRRLGLPTLDITSMTIYRLAAERYIRFLEEELGRKRGKAKARREELARKWEEVARKSERVTGGGMYEVVPVSQS